MAEEDLIFGKNRHMFGGIEPSNMKYFKVAPSRGAVTVSALLPDDTTVNGQLLCTVAGAVIRRKTTGYPTDEFDGDGVMTISESGSFVDTTADMNTDYYYAAFPYTTQGVYNRNPSNRAKYAASGEDYIFGFDLNKTDSNPSTRVSYPSDVDNTGYTPAGMNYVTGIFDYGDWPSDPGVKFMPSPCMLGYDGTVKYYLDPNDYTKKEDGTESDVSYANFQGNAMMEWPKIYTKREEVDGIYKFRCSNKPHGDGWECWCNYDKNNNQIDHFYTGIYYGSTTSLDANKLRSLSGYQVKTYSSMSDIVSPVGANGSDWYMDVLADRLLIQDLLIMISKNTNGQAVFGNGVIASNIRMDSGAMDTKGLFWGANDDTSGVKVFGMEHWWGHKYRALAGWLYPGNGKMYIKITRGTKDGSTATDYITTASTNYEETSVSTYIKADDSLATYTKIFSSQPYWLVNYKVFPYGRLPIVSTLGSSTGGSSATYDCDCIYFGYAYVYADWGDYDGEALVGRSYNVSSGTGETADSQKYAIGPFAVELTPSPRASETTRVASLSCKPSAA